MTCPAIHEENAEWDETIANGEIIYGKCVQIGYDGPISRVCVQDGINGTTASWSTIFGSCEGFFNFFGLFTIIKKIKIIFINQIQNSIHKKKKLVMHVY